MYPRAIAQRLAEFSESAVDLSPAQEALVAVDVGAQTLTLYRQSIAAVSYPVSTSRNGVGNLQDSYCTPLGLHEIAEKIGAGIPPGQVFIARQPQGRNYCATDVDADKDTITSRILWLRGLQQGYNLGGQCDSYRRYIYIHGTADEKHIGQPASIGCIRMRNGDVIDLFERVETGCRVLIYE